MRKVTFWGAAPKKQQNTWVNPAMYQFRTKEDWAAEMAKLIAPGSLILDTETTGTGSDARVIELSVIDMEGNILFSQLFSTGEQLPEIIPQITGITDEMLDGMPSFSEKAEEIGALLSGKTLIGWNVPFDRRLIESEFAAAGKLSLLSPAGWEDAMEMYAYSQGRAKKYCKLIKAKEEMGIGDSQEHRASADCLDTLAVMRRAAGLDKAEDLFSAAGEDIEEVDINDL